MRNILKQLEPSIIFQACIDEEYDLYAVSLIAGSVEVSATIPISEIDSWDEIDFQKLIKYLKDKVYNLS